jgi:hypothetical protein
MRIVTEHMHELDSSMEMKYKSLEYPTPGHASLPKMFFVGLWVGARGGGKTYSCAQLLKMYEHFGIHDGGSACAQRIILMTPTFEANPVWSSLKHLDAVHSNYTDQRLVDVIQDIKDEAEKTKTWVRRCKAWDRASKCDHPSKIRKKDMEVLMETMMQDPREMTERPRFEKPVVNFLVLDDLVGSSAFKAVGRSALTQVILRNRHLRLCVCILAQSLKSVPRTMRMNTSVLVLFKFANTKVVLDLHEEVSNLLTESEFEELYKYATTEHKHGCLIIDMSQPEPERFKSGWNRVLRLGGDTQDIIVESSIL